MLVMISLTYPSDDNGPLVLDIWNINAPSVAAVERLIREELAPALRRHGRIKALEQGFDESDFCPQALSIDVDATPICSLEGLVADLADQRGMPPMDDDLLRRCARPRHASREPAHLDALLTRHGIAGPNGQRLPHHTYKLKPNPRASFFDDEDMF